MFLDAANSPPHSMRSSDRGVLSSRPLKASQSGHHHHHHHHHHHRRLLIRRRLSKGLWFLFKILIPFHNVQDVFFPPQFLFPTSLRVCRLSGIISRVYDVADCSWVEVLSPCRQPTLNGPASICQTRDGISFCQP